MNDLQRCNMGEHAWHKTSCYNDFENYKHTVWMVCVCCERKQTIVFQYSKIKGGHHEK